MLEHLPEGAAAPVPVIERELDANSGPGRFERQGETHIEPNVGGVLGHDGRCARTHSSIEMEQWSADDPTALRPHIRPPIEAVPHTELEMPGEPIAQAQDVDLHPAPDLLQRALRKPRKVRRRSFEERYILGQERDDMLPLGMHSEEQLDAVISSVSVLAVSYRGVNRGRVDMDQHHSAAARSVRSSSSSAAPPQRKPKGQFSRSTPSGRYPVRTMVVWRVVSSWSKNGDPCTSSWPIRFLHDHPQLVDHRVAVGLDHELHLAPQPAALQERADQHTRQLGLVGWVEVQLPGCSSASSDVRLRVGLGSLTQLDQSVAQSGSTSA